MEQNIFKSYPPENLQKSCMWNFIDPLGVSGLTFKAIYFTVGKTD